MLVAKIKRLALFLALLSTRCSQDATTLGALLGTELVVVNDTGVTVYHWVVAQEALPLLSYTLNRCPDSPDRIDAGDKRVAKLADIFGYKPGRKVVLFWWVLGRPADSGCFEPARVSTRVLDPLAERVVRLEGFQDGNDDLEREVTIRGNSECQVENVE